MTIITLDDINNIDINYIQRAYALDLDTIDLEFEFLGYFHQLQIKDWNSLSPKYILIINSNIFINNKEELIIDIPESIVYLNNNDLVHILEINSLDSIKFLNIQQNQLVDYYSYFKFLDILKLYFDKVKLISFPILEYRLIKLLLNTSIIVKECNSLILYLEDIDSFMKEDYKDLYNLVILCIKDDNENIEVFRDYCNYNNIKYLICDSLY